VNSTAILAWNRVRHLEKQQPNLLELLFETTEVFSIALCLMIESVHCWRCRMRETALKPLQTTLCIQDDYLSK
jgi:hypothetical protein